MVNTMNNDKRISTAMLLTAVMLAAAVCAGQAQARDLLVRKVLPVEQARKAAAAAVAQCQKDGYRVSAAVVDTSGVLSVLIRADGAGPHTVESSRRKAYTAASLRRPTQALSDVIAQTPSAQGLRDMDDSILILGGGFPVRIGGDIVGGIGVGGSPGSQLDEACARAGLKAIDADLYKPTR